jgi:hypothetical protein
MLMVQVMYLVSLVKQNNKSGTMFRANAHHEGFGAGFFEKPGLGGGFQKVVDKAVELGLLKSIPKAVGNKTKLVAV